MGLELCVAEGSLELRVLLCLPPEFWDHSCGPQCLGMNKHARQALYRLSCRPHLVSHCLQQFSVCLQEGFAAEPEMKVCSFRTTYFFVF